MTFLFTYITFMPMFLAILFLTKGSNIGIKGTFIITLINGFISFSSLITLFVKFSNKYLFSYIFINYGQWFTVGDLNINWCFTLDSLSFLMISLVVIVSFITQIYSYFYLLNDPNLIRFQAYLNFFTFFMLILISADNFALFFLGWEGVGLCSYLLISFWFTRAEALKAALKAVIVNRIGDCAFIISIGIFLSLSGSARFSTLFIILPNFNTTTFFIFGYQLGVLTVANFFLLVAVSAKSAQLGLHIWLADAMEGPTPVSALIHAATMVTAGIYLVIRISCIFELTPVICNYMAILGSYTAFFGASVACFQWDIKKVIAYSTCSQLGYMLCCCGLGGFSTAFYHLISHGFFKALLFLAAGVLIHNLNGEQDIRFMGGLKSSLPLTFSYFVVGFSALIGLPGTIGFYSKERILDYASTFTSPSGVISYTFLWFALICTSFYSSRVMFYVFLGKFRGSKSIIKNNLQLDNKNCELPFYVKCSLFILVLIVLFGEKFYSFFMFDMNNVFLDSSIFSFSLNFHSLFIEELAVYNRLHPFFAIGFGIILCIFTVQLHNSINFWNFFFFKSSIFSSILYNIFIFFQKAWLFDIVLSFYFFTIFKKMSVFSITFEKGFCEWLGPYFISSSLYSISQLLDQVNINRSIFSNISIFFISYFVILFICF